MTERAYVNLIMTILMCNNKILSADLSHLWLFLRFCDLLTYGMILELIDEMFWLQRKGIFDQLGTTGRTLERVSLLSYRIA